MFEYCAENASHLAQWSYHAAMVLFAVSYALRDMLWLRVLAVVAGLLSLPFAFFCMGDGPRWDAVFWNSLFTVINAIRLGMLFYERRPVVLTAEERRLQMLVFRGLAPRELVRLLAVAEWCDAEPGTRLVEKGQPLDDLLVISSGIVDVVNDGRKFAESSDGQCIGEMSFVTGMAPSANVVAQTAVRYVRFPKPELDAMMQQDDRLREVVYSVLGFDMAEKLTARSRVDVASTTWVGE
jgi:hypothetical protein